jgi:uncharacterized coiled-coil protein SlyX
MLLSFVIVITSLTTAAGTKPVTSCNEIVDHCNQLIDESKEIIRDQESVIELQKEQLSLLTQNMQTAQRGWEEEKKRADAWYKDPFLVIPTAILAGFIAGEALRARGR